MISSPAALQVQLTEALTLIASSDFPEKWDSLVQVMPNLLHTVERKCESAHNGKTGTRVKV